jgi:hypothetical protein
VPMSVIKLFSRVLQRLMAITTTIGVTSKSITHRRGMYFATFWSHNNRLGHSNWLTW